MTVADFPLPPVTISSNPAPPPSDTGPSQAQSYRSRAVPEDGDGEDHVVVSPAPQHWPRIFPGL